MSEPDGRDVVTAAEDPPVDAPASARICPYILAGGGWRSPTPTGEHRCTAVEPPARLTAEKQRRLCLVPDHVTCATYLAAGEARGPAALAARRVGRRAIARTAPVVVERARPLVPAALRGERRPWGQIGLVTLAVVALVAIVITRSSTDEGVAPGRAGASPTTLAGTPTTTPTPTRPSAEPPSSPSPAVTEAPSATPRPTASPSPATTPVGTRSYTVRRGDTLSAIASRFGTTVRAIQELNGILDPSLIRVGQVLSIP